MSYDVKCEVLARQFLSDFEVPEEQRAVRVHALAQDIQDAIEDYLSMADLKERK